jgi:hypothetical protein
MKRALSLVLLSVAAMVGLTPHALAHRSGCHVAHSCPSDHHTYVWYDSSGRGWSCAEPGASEYDPARDKTKIVYQGRTYYCRRAGSSGSPSPRTTPPKLMPGSCIRARLPDRACTPGAVFRSVGKSQVCVPGHARRVRNVPQSLKNSIYGEYGIRSHSRGQFEVDHLVPLELGGSNAAKNLWPEAASPKPGFHEKDRLENALHERVCSGAMSLTRAQHLFERNWVAAYRRYVL